MKLFDAHCHLVEAEALERAAAAGVEGIALCGTSPDDWDGVVRLCRNHSFAAMLWPMIGIHPWFVPADGGINSNDWKNDFQALESCLREKEAAMLWPGIGECGLDFGEKFTNRAEQEECFIAHLELARELNRPVAVHCVQAWGRLVEILRDHSGAPVIVHAFSGAVELIPELTELKGYFSFCGNVTNPKAKRVHAAAAAVPAERLLIETDSPDFPPAGCEKPNEPANLIHVARAVAELRDVAVEEIAELTFKNAQALFDLKA